MTTVPSPRRGRKTTTTHVDVVEPTMYTPEQVARLNAKGAQLRYLRDQAKDITDRADELAAELADESKPGDDWVAFEEVDIRAQMPMTFSDEQAERVLSKEILERVKKTKTVTTKVTYIDQELLRDLVPALTFEACRVPKNDRPSMYVRWRNKNRS